MSKRSTSCKSGRCSTRRGSKRSSKKTTRARRRTTKNKGLARVFHRKHGDGKPYCSVNSHGKWKGCHKTRAAARKAAGL